VARKFFPAPTLEDCEQMYSISKQLWWKTSIPKSRLLRPHSQSEVWLCVETAAGAPQILIQYDSVSDSIWAAVSCQREIMGTIATLNNVADSGNF
jgi:hypothetical protein